MPEHTPAPTSSRSLYGFFMYMFSKIVLIVYCIWAFIPDYYLHNLNIHYYPQKYWATAVPIQCLVGLTMFAFFVYPSSNLMLTSKVNSVKTIHDQYNKENSKVIKNKYSLNNLCICKNRKTCMKYNYVISSKELHEDIVPKLKDLDISYVSKRLYLNNKII